MEYRIAIQNVAVSKKIPFLAHFTRAENIPSVLQNGLLPVSIAQERGLNPVINDQMRLDGRLNGTSLSISFPNGSLFYRFRNDNPEVGVYPLGIRD